MPYWNNNHPDTFGWTPDPPDIVPFVWRGHSFPAGVHRLVVPIFAEALRRLVDQAGLTIHPGPPDQSGNWGYEQRNIRGSSTTKSFHEFGTAIDVNAPWNGLGDANPPNTPWRLPDSTDQLVRPLGILWGGAPEFSSRYDRMHLEVHLSPSEAAAGLPVTVAPAGNMYPLPAGYFYGPQGGSQYQISGYGIEHARYGPGLVKAQAAMKVSTDGFFGPLTGAAVKLAQSQHKLVVDGLLGPVTWRALFPL